MTEVKKSRLLRAADRDSTAAVTLVFGVVVALVCTALSPSSYFLVFASRFPSSLAIDLDVGSLHDVILNALMSIFFFAIGLEISREFSTGLTHSRNRSIPAVLGAAGGMLVTALSSVGLGFALHSAALRRGWGIPMATDVAFTLAILAVAGRRLPAQLRIFLLTLAITDDVLSVLVLSVSGTSHPRPVGIAGLIIVALVALVVRHYITPRWGLLLLVALWLCFAWANVEPALAGVLAGVLIAPKIAARGRLELHASRVSSTLVLPLFAVAACGLHWSDLRLSGSVGTVIVATIGIRLVAKTLGITAGVALARLLHFRLHPSITWPLVINVGLLCAIGFTVPLFFASALFGDQSALYAGFDLGLLISSAVAAIVGGVLLRTHRPID